MHAAVRPFATAGVALVGAGVIAVTPVAPPLADIHIPALRADVALTQFVDPITNFVNFVTTTSQNLAALGAMTAANPTPVLSKIIANQTANAAAISAGLQTAGTDLANNLAGVPAQFQTQVLDELSAGNISGAIVNLLFEIPLGVALLPLLDAVQPLTAAANATTQNLANGVSTLTSNVLELGIGVLEPIFATVSAAGNIGQELFNALSTGDLTTAASVLINAPIDLTNALLNGNVQGSSVGDGVGILTPGTGFSGPVADVYNLLVQIAASLTGVPPAAASTLAAANVAPAAAASTVTVTTAPAATTAAATAPATTASANTVTANTAKTANTATTVNTGAAAASAATSATAGPAAKVTTGKVNATTGTSAGTAGLSGANTAAPATGGKTTADPASSTASKVTAGAAGGSGHSRKHGN